MTAASGDLVERAPSRPSLEGRTCIVTGASGGIGRAIASALASAGSRVCAVARRRDPLEALGARLNGRAEVVPYVADLSVESEVAALARVLQARERRVDVLVHNAGTIAIGAHETAPIEDLDRQYALNVRAPYLLTQALLPSLRATMGQIVFINSTAALAAKAHGGQYAATKHALRAIADALREEVNGQGIRVVSLYPGRTATPLQARLHALEGRDYAPERLLQPGDIAEVVLNVLTLPRTAEITDVRVRPMLKA